ncbi:MAG: phytanoyl-CoA dioxygenase family protein [Chloroflexi bacterium]|nr:phytanoyl-CoA dioxygenase family protein [Chloroflexota bacterium]
MRRLIGGTLADHREWTTRPSNQFTTDGYEVIPGFLADTDCDRLVALARHFEGSSTRALAGDAYFLRRGTNREVDTQVSQIMNAHHLDDGLQNLFESGRITSLFEERLGEPVVLESLTLQIDGNDTKTKRGLHVDRHTPPSFKSFVYLTDVTDLTNGPYTVVPRSHRKTAWRLAGAVVASALRRPKTDAPLFGMGSAQPIFGSAGTLILSCQQLAHRGWPGHSGPTRYVLIGYLSLARDWDGRPFRVGREFLDAAS